MIKITDWKIPFVIAIATACVFFSGLFLEDSNVSIITAIVILLSTVFIYFPLLIRHAIMREPYERGNKIIQRIGLSALLLVMIGMLIKVMHWPGAAIFNIAGTALFCLAYFPALLLLKWKKLDVWGRIAFVLLLNFMGNFLLYWLFKSMYWPLAGTLGVLTKISLNYILIPSLVLLFVLKRNSLRFMISEQLLLGFMFAYLLATYQTRNLISTRINADPKQFEKAVRNLSIYENKNNTLYASLFSSQTKDDEFLAEKEKARKLKIQSDSLIKYLNHAENLLISKANNISTEKADSLSFADIGMKDNLEVVRESFVGIDPDNLLKKEFSAWGIKQKIRAYKTQISQLVPTEIKEQVIDNLSLQTDSVPFEDNYYESWEVARFYAEPLGRTVTVLTELKSDIRYAEQQVLSEIFNKANFSRKESLASQLADLSAKYENEKKEKAIAILKKDNELSILELKNKNEEISQRESMLFYSVIGLIMFGVLTFFTIRSSILRKAANKKLEEQNKLIAEQKHIVEEKQKEIIDSIKYARRIQQALITNNAYIEKTLKKLKHA